MDRGRDALSRREFLRGVAAAVPVSALGSCALLRERFGDPRITAIERATLELGPPDGVTWFHPRACVMGGGNPPAALMTLQSIMGSDFYGPVHWTRSEDLGRAWSAPAPIEAFGRRAAPGDLEEGVCDVVPAYHVATDTVLAMGHTVFYRDDRLAKKQPRRVTVYAVGDGRGTWSERRRLAFDHDDSTGICTAGSSQSLLLEDGDVLVPLSYGPEGRADRGVTTVLCAFDGEQLSVKRRGNEMRFSLARGLLEPSLARFGGRYWMTIRAEDGRGYFAVSDDGLQWRGLHPWRWDDGGELVMSSTQQHWIATKHGLYLTYTRRAEHNAEVMRYRAPLYMASVDTEKGTLFRATECVVLPLRGDGVNAPERVPRMGNFHTTVVSDQEAWLTVGEVLPSEGWTGDVWLARIRWAGVRVAG